MNFNDDYFEIVFSLQETSPIHIRGMSSFLCEIGYGSMCVLGMVDRLSGIFQYSKSSDSWSKISSGLFSGSASAGFPHSRSRLSSLHFSHS